MCGKLPSLLLVNTFLSVTMSVVIAIHMADNKKLGIYKCDLAISRSALHKSKLALAGEWKVILWAFQLIVARPAGSL